MGDDGVLLRLPLVSKKGGVAEVWLERALPDDVCPITQELIDASDPPACLLTGKRRRTTVISFDRARPELNTLRLGCGHKFSALNLMYHWIRSHGVKCPVCRQGAENARLRRGNLPGHFRKAMARKATEELRAEHVELMAEDEREAWRLESAPFSGSMYAWCMARLGQCCLELRGENETTVGEFRDLTSMIFADRIVLCIEVDLPYRPVRMLGGVDHLRFPSSRVLRADEVGLVNLSHTMSTTQYWVEVGADGRIKQLNFEVLIHVFCVLALEQEQLRLLEVFAGGDLMN